MREGKHVLIKKKNTTDIWGLRNFTKEQRLWLLKPEIISQHKENEWTWKQRIDHFSKVFPDAPKMENCTLRLFYRNNGVKSSKLFKDFYNFTSKVSIVFDDDPIYLNGTLDEIPEPMAAHVQLLNEWRTKNPKKLPNYTDRQILYLVHPKTLKYMEHWN